METTKDTHTIKNITTFASYMKYNVANGVFEFYGFYDQLIGKIHKDDMRLFLQSCIDNHDFISYGNVTLLRSLLQSYFYVKTTYDKEYRQYNDVVCFNDAYLVSIVNDDDTDDEEQVGFLGDKQACATCHMRIER